MSRIFSAITFVSILLTCAGHSQLGGIERTSVRWPTKEDAWILYSAEQSRLLLFRHRDVLEELTYEASDKARSLAGGKIAHLPAPATERDLLSLDTIHDIYERAVKELRCGRRWKTLETRTIEGPYTLIHSRTQKCIRVSILARDKKIETDFLFKDDEHRVYQTISMSYDDPTDQGGNPRRWTEAGLLSRRVIS